MRNSPLAERGCRAPKVLRPGSSLRNIVDHYIAARRAASCEATDRFSRAESLEAAVAMATACTNERGKRHSHQRRIPGASLKAMHREVSALDLLRSKSFDDLHESILNATASVHMIGPLTVYDVAMRIGAYLKLAPKHVYLHAGTREGAKALGLGAGSSRIERSDLPPEFGRLTPAECEDVLCIYKDLFAVAASVVREK
jgi:hypothetical protein